MAEFTREQLTKHINDMMESSKEMIGGNGVPVEFVARAERDICVYEIALAALTEQPVGFYRASRHGDGYYLANNMEQTPGTIPLYRLPLLEGLK